MEKIVLTKEEISTLNASLNAVLKSKGITGKDVCVNIEILDRETKEPKKITRDSKIEELLETTKASEMFLETAYNSNLGFVGIMETFIKTIVKGIKDGKEDMEISLPAMLFLLSQINNYVELNEFAQEIQLFAIKELITIS